MERLAIFINDADYAQRYLEPLLGQRAAGAPCTLVMCPPRLTHRIGKFLSNRQRQHWQRHWCQQLQQALTERLPAGALDQVDWVVSGSHAADATQRLRRQHGPLLKVLDMRKNQIGQTLAPIDPGQPLRQDDRWQTPVAVSSSLSVMLALVD